jgi:hypothetical protein
MEACSEKMEVCLESKEPTSEEMKSETEHEVPKEDAIGETFGALKEWFRDRHLAVMRCSQLKKWTQGNGGSWKKLATTCRGMTRCAIPAWRTGHYHQGQGKDKAVPRTHKGQTSRKRHWEKLKGIIRIRNQGSRQQLHLKKERTTGNGITGQSRRQEPHLGSRTTPNQTFRKTAEQEIAKQIVRTSTRLQKMSVRTLGRGPPPPKRKKKLHMD